MEGDQGAWEMLVRTYSKKIFNLTYQFSGVYQEAEDLTQEIFLKLYKFLPKYDSNKNFNAWLVTLAKNHCIDHYRKTKLEKTHRDEFSDHLIEDKAALSPESEVLKKEKVKFVWQGLGELSPDIRMALIFRDIRGMSYNEVADSLNLPIGTIKSRINRGRLQLAKYLKKYKEGKK